MYIFNTCHPKAHLAQGYPPVVPTAECRLCGERVRLTPIEALTNRLELDSGSYACPLCRRLMAEAESSIPDGLDLSSLFPGNTAFPFSARTMNEMEDQYDDHYEGSAACARLQMKALMQKNAAMASFRLKQISGSRYMYT